MLLGTCSSTPKPRISTVLQRTSQRFIETEIIPEGGLSGMGIHCGNGLKKAWGYASELRERVTMVTMRVKMLRHGGKNVMIARKSEGAKDCRLTQILNTEKDTHPPLTSLP